MTYMTLPHPDIHSDTPTKRLLAWIVDTVIIAIPTMIIVAMTLFIATPLAPFIFAVLSFLYRWVTLAQGSATLGMRLFAVSIRNLDGSPLDNTTAFLHVAGYFVSVAIFPLQLISIGLMLITERKQGLTDHILGTAAFNNSARF